MFTVVEIVNAAFALLAAKWRRLLLVTSPAMALALLVGIVSAGAFGSARHRAENPIPPTVPPTVSVSANPGTLVAAGELSIAGGVGCAAYDPRFEIWQDAAQADAAAIYVSQLDRLETTSDWSIWESDGRKRSEEDRIQERIVHFQELHGVAYQSVVPRVKDAVDAGRVAATKREAACEQAGRRFSRGSHGSLRPDWLAGSKNYLTAEEITRTQESLLGGYHVDHDMWPSEMHRTAATIVHERIKRKAMEDSEAVLNGLATITGTEAPILPRGSSLDEAEMGKAFEEWFGVPFASIEPEVRETVQKRHDAVKAMNMEAMRLETRSPQQAFIGFIKDDPFLLATSVMTFLLGMVGFMAAVRALEGDEESVVGAWIGAIRAVPVALATTTLVAIPLFGAVFLILKVLGIVGIFLLPPVSAVLGPLALLCVVGASIGCRDWTPRTAWGVQCAGFRGVIFANIITGLATTMGTSVAWSMTGGWAASLGPLASVLPTLLIWPAVGYAMWVVLDGETGFPEPHGVRQLQIMHIDARSDQAFGLDEDVQGGSVRGRPSYLIAAQENSAADTLAAAAPAAVARLAAAPVATWHAVAPIDLELPGLGGVGSWIDVPASGSLIVELHWTAPVAPRVLIADGNGVWEPDCEQPVASPHRWQLQRAPGRFWLRVESTHDETQSVRIASWQWVADKPEAA
jgi:hypothetical protein